MLGCELVERVGEGSTLQGSLVVVRDICRIRHLLVGHGRRLLGACPPDVNQVVAGRGEQPRPQRVGSGLEMTSSPPGANEHLLHDILGHSAIPGKSKSKHKQWYGRLLVHDSNEALGILIIL